MGLWLLNEWAEVELPIYVGYRPTYRLQAPTTGGPLTRA